MQSFSINIDDLSGARKTNKKARGRKQKDRKQKQDEQDAAAMIKAVEILQKYVRLGILDSRDLIRVCTRCEEVADVGTTGSLFCPKCKSLLTPITKAQQERHLQRPESKSEFAKILEK